MIYRLRNILNWVAFVSLVITFVIIAIAAFNDGSRALSGLLELLSFNTHDPYLYAYWVMCTCYLYPLWVFIQYIIWKHPVFIPWHFKDDEE